MSEQCVRQQIDEASLPREELDSRLQGWQDNSQSKAGGGAKSLPCTRLARLNPEYCAHFGSPATGVTGSEGEKRSEELGVFSRRRRRLLGNMTAAFRKPEGWPVGERKGTSGRVEEWKVWAMDSGTLS